MSFSKKETQSWKKDKVAVSLATFCALLWGTAVPIVKLSQSKFGIAPDDLYSIILFVGARICLAGLALIVIFSISRRELILPSKRTLFPIFMAGTVQTVMQHLFLYFGLMFTTGAKGSILSSTTAIIGVLLAHFLMREDKFTVRKGIACVISFTGIIILNISNISVKDFGFSLRGDLLILLSAVFAALGSIISKKITMKEDPIIVASWQLFLSGILASAIGFIGGGRIMPEKMSSWLIFLYLAFISATAYVLWTTLLKYHNFSRINIYKSLIPVVGSIISAIFLKERVFRVDIIMALILVSYSVFLISGSAKPVT